MVGLVMTRWRRGVKKIVLWHMAAMHRDRGEAVQIPVS